MCIFLFCLFISSDRIKHRILFSELSRPIRPRGQNEVLLVKSILAILQWGAKYPSKALDVKTEPSVLLDRLEWQHHRGFMYWDESNGRKLPANPVAERFGRGFSALMRQLRAAVQENGLGCAFKDSDVFMFTFKSLDAALASLGF